MNRTIQYSKRAQEARMIAGLRRIARRNHQAHDDLAWACALVAGAAFAFTLIFWS